MIPWTVAELDDLARDYPADAHADVAALIAGARAVLRLHASGVVVSGDADGDVCCECVTGYSWGTEPDDYPCRTVRALSLEESP